MNYQLYNNHEVHEGIFLLEIKIIEDILEQYHQESEIRWIESKCGYLPKINWISEGLNLPRFNVPLLHLSFNGELRINDGRHRVYWMKKCGMQEIPIAITESAIDILKSKNINMNMIEYLDMPCSTIPNSDSEFKSPGVNYIMSKLANCSKKNHN